MALSNRQRGLLYIVAGAVLLLGLAAGRVWWSGRAALRQAETYQKAGKRRLAIFNYARAIRWYVPGADHVDDAASQLWKIAEGYRKQGRTQLALFAYRRLRTSLYSVRSFWLPHEKRVKACEERIADIISKLPATTARAAKLNRAQRKKEALALFRKDHAANPWLSLLAGLLMLGWLGAAGAALWIGFGPEAAGRRKRAAIWSFSAAVGFVAWLIVLYFA